MASIFQHIVHAGGSVIPFLDGTGALPAGAFTSQGLKVVSEGAALVLPGLAGEYASTPSTALNTITGKIDIQAIVQMPDWTPLVNSTIISKWDVAPDRAWNFRANAVGTLGGLFSTTGSDAGSASSDVHGFIDGTTQIVRVTRRVGGLQAFFHSMDGVTWIPLGTSSSTAGDIFAGTADVRIGAREAGGAGQPLEGKIFRAVVFPDIIEDNPDAQPVIDFNPIGHTGESSWVGRFGETWTVNGSQAFVSGPQVLSSNADAIAQVSQGIPFSAEGRVCTSLLDPVRFGPGATPFDANNRVCIGGIVNHHHQGIGYAINGALATVA